MNRELAVTPGCTDGGISLTFSTCDIEGKRTIHLDVNSKIPYGHISPLNVESIIKFLTENKKWLREGNHRWTKAKPTKSPAEGAK